MLAVIVMEEFFLILNLARGSRIDSSISLILSLYLVSTVFLCSYNRESNLHGTTVSITPSTDD